VSSAVVTLPLPDADGFDLRPDPLQAKTPADLVRALRQYRLWAGEPPLRTIARRAGIGTGASTICAALNAKTLPRLETVIAIITGCGGSEEDQRRFTTAWRAIRLSQQDDTAR
jgi:hypothetical protein